MKIPKFGLVMVALTSLFITSCAKRRGSYLGPGNQQAQLNNPQSLSRVNIIKGKILSVTEDEGLVGWVCEENNPSPKLQVLAGNNPVDVIPDLRLNQSDAEAQSQCSGVGVPLTFSVPYANLSGNQGSLLSVLAIPQNNPMTPTKLGYSDIYRIPNSNPNPNPAEPPPSTAPSTANPAPTNPPTPPMDPIPLPTNTSTSIPGNPTITQPLIVQVCTPNALEQSPCAVANGSGSQSRTCSSDGTDRGTFGACVAQSCDAGYFLQSGACIRHLCSPGATIQQSCSIANGTGTQAGTCNAMGSAIDYGACAPTTCNPGFMILNGACSIPGPTDSAQIEPGKRVGADPVGKLDGRSGSGDFGGWVCQKNLRNSLTIKVYVGTTLQNKRYVGEFVANQPEDAGVSNACSDASQPYSGRRRFIIPLSTFSASDKGKKVIVFAVKHDTTTESRIRFPERAGFSQIVP